MGTQGISGDTGSGTGHDSHIHRHSHSHSLVDALKHTGHHQQQQEQHAPVTIHANPATLRQASVDGPTFNAAPKPHSSFRSTSSSSALTASTLSFSPALKSFHLPVFAHPSASIVADHELSINGIITKAPSPSLIPHHSLPLSLPLPLLTSLNAESNYSVSAQTMTPINRLMYKSNVLARSLTLIDWFLPTLVKDKTKYLAANPTSSQSLSECSVASLRLAGLTCQQFGQHVCIWRWRGSLLLTLLVCVLSLVLTLIFDYYQLRFFTQLYSTLSLLSLVLVFAPHQFNDRQARVFIKYFPSVASYTLFLLVTSHSLYSGASHGLLTLAGCAIVIAMATFMLGVQMGLKLYCLSLILIVATYARSFFTFAVFQQTEEVLLAADAERFILYSPLMLSLLAAVIFVMDGWFVQSQELLKRSIDDQQQLKDAAIAASKMKSDFLANVSHDVRTPMNAILGFLQLALGDMTLGDETRECLSTAYTSAEDLLVLLNDVLDISKIESGHLRFESIVFDLFSVYEKSVRTFAGSAQKKNVELIVDIDPRLQSKYYQQVIGDPSRLAQVINNLLSNAVKFTNGERGEHNEIVVRVSLLPAIQRGFIHILTSVSDSGEGISPEGLARIFKPFTQADSTISRRHGGSGLGLTISSELVKLSGGRIWCQSEPGNGSVFSFTSQFAAVTSDGEDASVNDCYNDSCAGADIQLSGDITVMAGLNIHTVSDLEHARSAPLPTRKILDNKSAPMQLRILLAVNNPINTQVLARAVSNWTNKQFANCSPSTPCNKCTGSFTFDSAVGSGGYGQSSPLPLSPPSHTPSVTERRCQSSHHTIHIEVVPAPRVTSDNIVHELQWAKTTRQCYDLVILDESAPKLDTVKVMVAMAKKQLTAHGRPGVLILTTRLLSPIMRGNGTSTYVLISKPVLQADLNKALQLLLRVIPDEMHSTPVIGRRLTSSARRPLANTGSTHASSDANPSGDNGKTGYVGSSRRPKDDSLAVKSADGVQSRSGDEKSAFNSSELLREAAGLSRVDISGRTISGHSCHFTPISAPSSPLLASFESNPSPSSAPPANNLMLSAGSNTIRPSPSLPDPALWTDRAQSLPAFFNLDQDSLNSSQSLAQSSKTRSKSMHTALFPFEPQLTSVPFELFPSNTQSSPSSSGECVSEMKETYKFESVLQSSERADGSPLASPQSILLFSSPISVPLSGTVTPSTEQLPPSSHACANNGSPPRSDMVMNGQWTQSPSNLKPSKSVRVPRTAVAPVRRLLPSSHAAKMSAHHHTSSDSPSHRGRSTSSGTDSQQGDTMPANNFTSSPASPASSIGLYQSPEATNRLSSASSTSSASPTTVTTITSSAPSRMRSTGAPHVLCVDDNKVNLKVASKMLARLGYVCHTANSGEEAIQLLADKLAAHHHTLQLNHAEYPELIRGESADEDRRRQLGTDPNQWIVLMDILMDGMDGHQATRRLREAGFTMPVYALTGNCTLEDKEKCSASGMQGFLEKPLRMEALETALLQATCTIQQSQTLRHAAPL